MHCAIVFWAAILWITPNDNSSALQSLMLAAIVRSIAGEHVWEADPLFARPSTKGMSARGLPARRPLAIRSVHRPCMQGRNGHWTAVVASTHMNTSVAVCKTKQHPFVIASAVNGNIVVPESMRMSLG
jgi:hypothetical protein